MFRKFSPFFWYGILAAAYIILSLLLPVSPKTLDTLHLNVGQYRLVLFAVIIPYVLIWFAAFYAYIKMDQYKRLLGNSLESPAFHDISLGLRVMAWGLAIPAIANLLLKAIAVKHPGFTGAAAIIGNYLTLLVPLIAYTYIGNGSHRLATISKAQLSKNGFRLFVIAFIVLAAHYTFQALISRRFNGNPYHLSRELMILTIIIPYLYAWFLGFLSCYELSAFARKVKGLLYKRALNLLTFGVGLMIISSIFIQFIGIVYASNENSSLGFVLVLVYILLAIEAAGFIMIGSGAARLKRIEEI